MSLLPMLSGEVQRSVDEQGTPVPVLDESEHVLMLVEPVITQDPDRGYSAHIPGINAIGEGDTKEEAALALSEALRSCWKTFGAAGLDKESYW